jgi:ribonucleoside-triphosphate reductase (thioredoxin)
MSTRPFKLSDSFLEEYKHIKPDWGPLGEVTYLRTYSRKVNWGEESERNEQWWETVRRVVEGTFTIQKEHVHKLKLPWNNDKAQKSAQKMYDKIFNFKFLPPGRGLTTIA